MTTTGHQQTPGRVRHGARVTEPTSGRVMEVSSTEPGLQFYLGNFLDGTLTGKGGWKYQFRDAFCMDRSIIRTRRTSRTIRTSPRWSQARPDLSQRHRIQVFHDEITVRSPDASGASSLRTPRFAPRGGFFDCLHFGVLDLTSVCAIRVDFMSDKTIPILVAGAWRPAKLAGIFQAEGVIRRLASRCRSCIRFPRART